MLSSMGRPREHDDETRSAVLASAGRLLATEGAGAVTVRAVAREAGTTTRAVYSGFGDKAGLLRALFREAAEAMRRHHEGVPVTADPVAEITALALAYRAGAFEQPNLFGLYQGKAVPNLVLTPDDLALAFRSLDRVLDTLRRCAAAGRLGGRDPEDVARQLWGLVSGLAMLELEGYLGDPILAEARWRDAIGAAMTGYDQPPR
jgi:AcrR family transcriptional regulator